MQELLIESVKLYLPGVCQLLKLKDTVLEKKISAFNKRTSNLPSDYQPDKPHCLFDWIGLAVRGNTKAISFLKFVDVSCISLIGSVQKKFRSKIEGTIKELFFAMDKDVSLTNNPAYMNFLAEIVGALHLIKESNGLYELIEIEGSLSNGKTADLVFQNKETNELIYIDFVSIHNIDVSKVESDEGLVNFLESKFNEKIKSKTEGIPFCNNILTIDGKDVIFSILPIVWSETVDLLPFIGAFDQMEKKYSNVLQCCSLHNQKLEDGSFVYSFSTVRNILNDWQHFTDTKAN